MNKGFRITIIIVLGVIAISYYALSKNETNPNDEFAKCVSEKAILYMQTGCFA